MLTLRLTPATSTLASRLSLVDDLDDLPGDGQTHATDALLSTSAGGLTARRDAVGAAGLSTTGLGADPGR